MSEVRIVTSHAEFTGLRGPWNALADRSGSPLLQHEWFAAAAAHFAKEGDLRIFLACEGQDIHAAAPLVVDRSGPLPRLRLLGFQLMEPQALLYDQQSALEAVCTEALSAGLPLSLPRIAAASPESAALCAAARARGVHVHRASTTRTHATVLQSDWAAFEKSMTSRQASIIRRRRKKLAEDHGEVVFEALSPDEASVESALADLLRVEAASWKARQGTSMLHDDLMGRFIRDYAGRAAQAGSLRIFNLRAGGEVVAAQMVVEHAGRLWGVKLGADERFYKYGVGVMVTHDIMRWGCERNLLAFEHLGVAEEYQQRWPLQVHEQSTFHFYSRNASGAAALVADTLQYARRRVEARVQARAARRAAPAQAAEAAAA